jgi:hypothetical protein
MVMRRGRGRPPKPDEKINQALRLDPDVLEAFRSGWRARINEIPRENMPRRHKIRSRAAAGGSTRPAQSPPDLRAARPSRRPQQTAEIAGTAQCSSRIRAATAPRMMMV